MHTAMSVTTIRSCLLSRILIGSNKTNRIFSDVSSKSWTAVTRSTSTSTPSPTSAAAAASTVANCSKNNNKVESAPRRDQLDLTFNNAEAAFKSKSTAQILRAYLVFTLCSSNYLVNNNMKVTIMQRLNAPKGFRQMRQKSHQFDGQRGRKDA